MRRKLLLACLLSSALILGGCWDQRIVEQMEFIINVGIDAAPDGRILVSMTAPFLQITPPKPVLYATIADTTRQAREQIRLTTGGRLEEGKMEQVLIGETLARRGSLDYLEPFIRDPINPVLARIMVVKGTAKNFLEKAIKWKNLPLPGVYLGRLLDQAEASSAVPDSRIDRFFVRYYAPGIDPVLAMAEATPTRAHILGVALFQDDHMAGRLNVDETYLLVALAGKAHSRTQTLPVPGELARGKKKMSIRFTNVKAKPRLRIKAGVPEVAYELEFTGLLEDFQMGYPVTDKVLKEIETSAAGSLTAMLETLWGKLVAANSDPLGLGNQVRARFNEYWLAHDWRKVYPAIEARFRVQVDLLNYGVMR